MDMYHVYQDVVHQSLPQAWIIVDRFHIQRMANEVIEAMRKRFRKTLLARQHLKPKDERFLLLKRQHNLTPADFERLAVWFNQFPLLSEAHALKEGFLSIWGHTTRPSAEAAWQDWLANVPPELKVDFKALVTAMTHWHQEIFNYFENPITSAFTESSNNLTRVIIRMGRGYSFDVIHARMLFNALTNKQGTLVKRKPAPTKRSDDGLMGKALPSPIVEPSVKQSCTARTSSRSPSWLMKDISIDRPEVIRARCGSLSAHSSQSIRMVIWKANRHFTGQLGARSFPQRLLAGAWHERPRHYPSG